MALPDAFSANSFATLLGISREVAAVNLSRWAAAGYIKASGRRTGFYFNVLKRRDAPEVLASEALMHVYPTAIVRGASVLHARGLTTQYPHEVHVGVLAPANRAHTDGFSEVGRSRGWYEAIQSLRVGGKAETLYGLPALAPEVALADLFASKNDWHPDVDDLELEDVDWSLFKIACTRFGVSVPEAFQGFVADTKPLVASADEPVRARRGPRP